MIEDYDPQADWLVRQWLFRGPIVPERLDRSNEEIIQSAWDEFAVLLEEKGLSELQAIEDHLKGVVRAISFHSRQTQHAILTHKADTPEGLDPSNLPGEEESALYELDEWIRHEETQARVANIQREVRWQRQTQGQPGQNHEEGNGEMAKEATDEHSDHMKLALDHRALLRDLYHLTDLRFSVLQGVMFYSTAFGIRTKWDDLSAEAQHKVTEQATGRGRPEGTDKFPQDALALLRVILDFTANIEEGERAFFRTIKEDRDSLCKTVGSEAGISQSGAASRIKAVFRQVSERCDLSLPKAEENVPFYIECRDQIEEAAETVERELL